MSRSLRPIIIAAVVLVLLAAALVIILLTAPKEGVGSSEQDNTSNLFSFFDDDDSMAVITNLETDKVLKLSVSNENGGYTAVREERDGKYCWKTGELGDVKADEKAIRRNIESFAQLAGIPVEENVVGDELEQYGLAEAKGRAYLSMEDGTDITILFGIRNPANTNYVYCTVGDGRVFQAVYVNVADVFSDARPFADLQMTEELADDVSGQPEYVIVTKNDTDTAFELRYMSELDGVTEDMTVTTTNCYRFVEPIRAEVDAENASGLYKNLCGLEFHSCEYLERSEENLVRCGLDVPQTVVKFLYNNEEHVLNFGNGFVGETSSGGTIDCYYVTFDDRAGIFSLEKRRAPWCSLNIFKSISKRLLSPYIYGCESVEITTPDGEFKFDIDEPNKRFTVGGKIVDSYSFRQLYSRLIGEVGDELYTETTEGEPVLRVRFNYKDEYAALYGSGSDELCYLNNDGRRYVVNFNGSTLFKVNQIYVQGIIDSVKELVNN